MTNPTVPSTPQFNPQLSPQPFGYVVLQDHEAQLRADKRRNELLIEQSKNIQATYYERLGGILEAYPPQARKQMYATHEPLFLVPDITVDDWLAAYDSQAKRAEFLSRYGDVMLSLLLNNPPEGAPVTDPISGQVIEPGSPTYHMRQDLWNRETQRVMSGQPSLCAVLTDYWRSLYVYQPRRAVQIVRDFRKLSNE